MILGAKMPVVICVIFVSKIIKEITLLAVSVIVIFVWQGIIQI